MSASGSSGVSVLVIAVAIFLPLPSKIFEDPDRPPNPQSAWSHYIGGNATHEQLSAGYAELKEFVETQVADLIDLENGQRDVQVSDLELFCRIDVGIMRSNKIVEGVMKPTLNYFVLEVERGLATCMWGWHDWSKTCADINTVAHLLPAWVHRVRTA